jgi:hypothetical protein
VDRDVLGGPWDRTRFLRGQSRSDRGVNIICWRGRCELSLNSAPRTCLLSCPSSQVTPLVCQMKTYKLCTPIHQHIKPQNSSERQATCSNPWAMYFGYLSFCFVHLWFLQLLCSCDQGNSSCSSMITEWGNGFMSAVTAASVLFAYGRNLFVLLADALSA